MARGDGRLTHDVLPGEKGPQDACGVFGVWAPGEEVAKLTYFGLYALQHRGQESAGIAVSDGDKILVYKDMGLVAQVFDESALQSLQGSIAVGHTRYSTTGGSTWQNAQPTLGATAGGTVALAHNGNLITCRAARPRRRSGTASRCSASWRAATPPTRRSSPPCSPAAPTAPSRRPRSRCCRTCDGAFSFVFMDEHTLYAARDPHGIRPLVLGRLDRGWVVASETAALDIVGACGRPRGRARRARSPSTPTACARARFAPANPSGCVFEYVYLARPDTTIAGRPVHAARVEMGRRLAARAPRGRRPRHPRARERHARGGRATRRRRGIPYGQGLVKNAYVGRTFIQPSQTIRQLGIRLKLNPLREVIRGQAARRRRRLDRARQHPAGARPDAPRGRRRRGARADLEPAGHVAVLLRHRLRHPRRARSPPASAVDEVRASIGADSLGYISLEGMVEATRQPRERLCTACFTGEYPIPLPVADLLGKHALETPAAVDRPARRVDRHESSANPWTPTASASARPSAPRTPSTP